MKRKRKKVKVARRKNEFSRALAAAKAVLAAKTRQRQRALRDLSELNIDIPNLERTVRALTDQLGNSPVVSSNESRRTIPSAPAGDLLKGLPASEEIPANIRAQLPKEDLTGMGSHFGNELPESGENLPEITGKELIPEKP